MSTQSHREDAVSPPASRHRVSSWRDPRLVVGVALVALCTLLGATLLGGGDGSVGVWATRTALVEGQGVTTDDLVRREISFSDQADADRYLSADQPLPEGRVLSRAVGAGELLARTAVAAGEQEDAWEVPVPVAPEGVPSTVTAGSVVDVWATPELGTASRAEEESSLILDDVRVVGVARAAGGVGAGGSRSVVVAVDEGQQDVLPTALARMARGTVVLVRNP